MGCAVVLEARRIDVFGGQAMGLVVFNFLFTIVLGLSGYNISLGGHIGGLIGGALAALAFTSLRRQPALATISVVAVGALSVVVAVAQV
jgi:membrane associated rhomboid family serine protease